MLKSRPDRRFVREVDPTTSPNTRADKEGCEESEGAGEEDSNGSSPPPEDDLSDEDDKQ